MNHLIIVMLIKNYYLIIANNINEIKLYPHQWDAYTNILDIINCQNDFTYSLSRVYYPTTHLFLSELLIFVVWWKKMKMMCIYLHVFKQWKING